MRRAFTLVEVLVVISIIALLIAILLPVLSSAKYSVRTTQCTSRLGQVGTAATAYAVDNDGRYPHKMSDVAINFVSPYDGERYRRDTKPWVVRSTHAANSFDYIPLIDPYVESVAEIFTCPHVDYDWDQAYSPSTNATIISYALYWGITAIDNGSAVYVPQARIGEGFGPASRLQGGGITQESRYHILASDMVAWRYNTNEMYGNHPPKSGAYTYVNGHNGGNRGYAYADTNPGNANYLYDDGSVQMYGQIRASTIGKDAEDQFRAAFLWWLAPTDRVAN